MLVVTISKNIVMIVAKEGRKKVKWGVGKE